jgi:hypothetical protein
MSKAELQRVALSMSFGCVAGLQDQQQRTTERAPTMRIVLSDFISLDGVVQAPGGQGEDIDGGFAHGGWARALELVSSKTTGTGVLICTYRPAGRSVT